MSYADSVVDELSPSNMKPEVRYIHDGGTWPWVARVNPGNGMYTAGRRFPTWRDAMDWLCERLWTDPEPWIVQGDGWEQRLESEGDNESRYGAVLMPRTYAEYVEETKPEPRVVEPVLTGEALCRSRGHHRYSYGSSGLGFCEDCPRVEGD